MPATKKNHKRIQLSPVRLRKDLDKLFRDIADNEARSIGQVVDATLRYALKDLTQDNWYEKVYHYLRQ